MGVTGDGSQEAISCSAALPPAPGEAWGRGREGRPPAQARAQCPCTAGRLQTVDPIASASETEITGSNRAR